MGRPGGEARFLKGQETHVRGSRAGSEPHRTQGLSLPSTERDSRSTEQLARAVMACRTSATSVWTIVSR